MALTHRPPDTRLGDTCSPVDVYQLRKAEAKADLERGERMLAAMPPHEAGLRRQIQALREMPCYGSELMRELYVTPFDGAYGGAGMVVTLNGSPPRLVVVIVPDASQGVRAPVVYVLYPMRRSPLVIDAYKPAKWQPLRDALLGYVAAWEANQC